MLDTNGCIRYLNGRAPGLKSRVDAAQPEDLLVCSVVKAELFFGAARSNDPPKTLGIQNRFLSRFTSLPFDDHAAEEYARVRAELWAAGRPIGPNDLLIAAIAPANDVTLVSHNMAEFSRIARLRVEDWELPPP
jgi:tRNA(fMet)-specific endonuclease VapC